MNYEQDIRIDETALDVEWLEQPALMFRYAQMCAEARQEFDKAKENLDLVRAELDRAIRANPDSYDIEKITDKVVENTIPTQDEFKEASTALIEAKFQLDIAYGAVKAIDARKDSLENLVKLHGQSYFAGPKMPRNLPYEVEEREKRKKTDAGIRKRMRHDKE